VEREGAVGKAGHNRPAAPVWERGYRRLEAEVLAVTA